MVSRVFGSCLRSVVSSLSSVAGTNWLTYNSVMSEGGQEGGDTIGDESGVDANGDGIGNDKVTEDKKEAEAGQSNTVEEGETKCETKSEEQATTIKDDTEKEDDTEKVPHGEKNKNEDSSRREGSDRNEEEEGKQLLEARKNTEEGNKEHEKKKDASAEGDTGKQQDSSRGGFVAGLKRWFTADYPKRDRHHYEMLSLEEKRKLYRCRTNYVTLDAIDTWPVTRERMGNFKKRQHQERFFNPFPLLDRKVSLWRGDITQLEIGAIVNAANSSLLGGGGVDGAIHRAAGHSLYEECRELNGCDTGQTKLTSGHALPAKYILHTVGPYNGSERDLRSCYTTCLELVEKHSIKSVAFCCIATGVYGYPNDEAADIALDAVRKWLEKNSEKMERIIFCVFLETDLKIYRRKLHQYFPEETEDVEDQLGLKAGSKERESKDASGKTDGSRAGSKERESKDASGKTDGSRAGSKERESKDASGKTDGSKEGGCTIPSFVRSATEPAPCTTSGKTAGSEEENTAIPDTQKTGNNKNVSGDAMDGVEGHQGCDEGEDKMLQEPQDSTSKRLKEEDEENKMDET